MNAALYLTSRCNLGCSYCFADACLPGDMRGEILAQSVAFLRQRSAGDFGITMFGGEPLLRGDLIQQLVSVCDGMGEGRPSLYVSTNGTLITPDFIRLCVEKEIGLFLSLDGVEEAHDRHRRYRGGRGTFADIVARVPTLLAALPYTIAVAVVTPQTAALVSRSAAFLFSLGFQYVLMTPDFNAAWSATDLGTLEREYRIFAEHYKTLLRQGRKAYFSLFDERIKTQTAERNCPGNCCDLAETSVAIAPDGRLFPCVQFVRQDGVGYCIGDVFRGLDEAARTAIVRQNHAPRETCAGCALEGRCFNWCGCVNWRNTGRLNCAPPAVCEHERRLMPIADEIGNELYAERNETFLRKFYDRDFLVASFIENAYLV